MKVIFLDVDGVLNYIYCDAREPCGCIGISNASVKNLAKIVNATGAVIVLTSTWKKHWQRDIRSTDQLHPSGKYLQSKLMKQKLFILDKTTDDMDNRGEGIQNWLANHPGVTHWIVLDDDIFPDYQKQGILPHLVKTSFNAGGLTESLVNEAIRLLNTDVDR